MKKISFIGSGNLAWHLAPALDNCGYSVGEVFSRDHGHASALVNRLYQAEVKHDLNFCSSSSEIFFVCVSDDAIVEIAREIILPDNALLIHTSGSQPLGVLDYAATENIGVFYPLQTFSKTRSISFDDVPVFIEATNRFTQELLLKMARQFSTNVQEVSSKQRQIIHLAAVIAGNFTNHFLKVASDILSCGKLDLQILHPLITETVKKSLEIDPGLAQTGPAKRHDLKILDKHFSLLYKGDPELAEMYRIISQHIIDSYPDN